MSESLAAARFRAVVVLGGAITLAAVMPLGSAASPTSAASAAGHCTYSQLAIRDRPAGAAAGHDGVRLHFRNTSNRTCSLHGYPGAAGLNKHGKQVTQAKRTKSGMLGGLKPGNPIPTVNLQPGQEATAVVEGTDVPHGHQTKCPELHGLLVTAPNVHKSVHFRDAPPDCSRIQVHPVIRGKSGSQLS